MHIAFALVRRGLELWPATVRHDDEGRRLLGLPVDAHPKPIDQKLAEHETKLLVGDGPVRSGKDHVSFGVDSIRPRNLIGLNLIGPGKGGTQPDILHLETAWVRLNNLATF